MSEESVFNTRAEHTSLKESIKHLDKSILSIASRQDGTDKVISEMLETLKTTAKTEERISVQHDKMNDMVHELTKIFGDIKVELANAANQSRIVMDDKLKDVYEKIAKNGKDIVDFEIGILEKYTTTSQLYKQVGSLYVVGSLLFVLVAFIYTNHVDRNKEDMSMLSTAFMARIEMYEKNMNQRIREKSRNHLDKLETLNSKLDLRMNRGIK